MAGNYMNTEYDNQKNAWDAMRERIAELEKESAQWQESSGQNYVRATEAEMEAEMELKHAIADEREACALLCEQRYDDWPHIDAKLRDVASSCAEAIRARGSDDGR